MNKILMITAPILFFTLSGCVSQPKKAPLNIKTEIQTGDYGLALNDSSFPAIKDELVQSILNQIQKNMVDPDSTKITGIQTTNFYKCVLNLIKPGLPAPNSTDQKGYCVAFEYNSRNRMGGYGGSQPSVALVRLDRKGNLILHTPTKALQTSEVYRYPYTHETGVYALSYGF